MYSPEEIELLKYHTFVIDLVDYHTQPSLTSCVSHAQISTICYVLVCGFQLLLCRTLVFLERGGRSKVIILPQVQFPKE